MNYRFKNIKPFNVLMRFIVFFTLALILFYTTSCSNSSEKSITNPVVSKKTEPKQSSQIVTAEKKEEILKRAFPVSNRVRLIRFEQNSLMHTPGQSAYEAVRHRDPLKIISTKYINDSTLRVRMVGVVSCNTFDGKIGEINDTLFLSITRPSDYQPKTAIEKKEFEYIIRIKKGKRYKLAIFKSRYPVSQK